MTTSSGLTPSRSMSSRRQLVLELVRRHYRAVGQSPSHSEIAAACGLQRQHVGRVLEDLRVGGHLTYERGRPRSIVLVDRTANLSDTELRLACIARGMTVFETKVPALSAAFASIVDEAPENVPDLGLPLIQALKHIE